MSKASHKNVAVWSTRSTLVSGRLVKYSRASTVCVTTPHCTVIIIHARAIKGHGSRFARSLSTSLSRAHAQG